MMSSPLDKYGWTDEQLAAATPAQSELAGAFKRKYGETLQGRRWLCSVDPDDVKVFVHFGLKCAGNGVQGGRARARAARRDSRGRFMGGG